MNQTVFDRIRGIQEMLKAVHQSSTPLSDATTGTERAAFVEGFLGTLLPSPFRSGTGDATDMAGNRSGQLDVVVENSFCPSFPLLGTSHVRLYLAEAVAAVVEVKSNVEKQWLEARRTAEKLAVLRREFSGYSYVGSKPTARIPFFVVGYEGWSTAATVKAKLSDELVDGILVINPGVFASGGHFGNVIDEGPAALWGFVACLYQATNAVKQNTPDIRKYLATGSTPN